MATTIRGSAWGVAAIAFGAGVAAGAPATDDDEPAACFRYSDAIEPPASDAPKAPDSPAPAEVPEFGAAGSRWWTVGAGVAYASGDSTDTDVNLVYSYFLAKDIEFGAELAGWYFNQEGDNTGGASLSMVFRWHFVNTGKWTVYGDAGIGFLVAGDEVPEGGTDFDLMPRIGAGFTRRLTDDGLRLQVGGQWHHISNARINGDSNNPARDEPMIYAGIIFPF